MLAPTTQGTVSAVEFRKAVRELGFAEVRDVDIDHVFREFDEDNSGLITQVELERRMRKYAGVIAEQRHALRRVAGGRKGAALATTVKLDRTSAVPIVEQLRCVLAANAVRVIDLFRDWDEDANGLVDKAEFARVMPSLGLAASREETNALFDSFE